jgi:hypothetical protein
MSALPRWRSIQTRSAQLPASSTLSATDTDIEPSGRHTRESFTIRIAGAAPRE